ncbi:DUF454 family protein [Rahnella sp. C60]|uniref:Inner membrane protein n=1 Tax=Rahnella perminowiae TaxID=2816244 RepID=A0ABS6L7L1_9GAMM|nr:DUF454 family protein [Rahnella perminowiae]UJD90511.1 DUF454 family protein [Rahnella aquatilis]MBU9811193.1 DUF454 family protein [Rahnella perminowiae]MBU9816176.1 DUF454 family protein [Rahnella perminowiae]MBU9837848.1 DUF454 family protein [Rahnella perminowiae]MCR9000352.1 DUF454 family protein [Rahnella perminowiae]
MKRVLLITLGWLCVVLATLGVVLPLLPTTPFLLLAVWCFARSSPRFHQWLLYRSWFGSYLRHWQTHRALPKGVKPKAIVLIVVSLSVSIYFVPLLWVRILLVCMMFALLIMMWRLPVVDLEQ